MKANKKQSRLNIVLSGVALLAFVLFSLCDILMVKNYAVYFSYGWRQNLLNYLILFVPFIALFTFSILSQKLEYINHRVYITGIFGIYLIQSIAIFFCEGTSQFSILCCSFLGKDSKIIIAITIIRILILFLIPIASKIMIKMYSIGMIVFLIISLGLSLMSNNISMGYHIKNIFAILTDVLFCVSLFFVGELLSENNNSKHLSKFLEILMYPIFGSMVDDDLEDVEYLNKLPGTDYACEYSYLVVEALNSDDEEFLRANKFFKALSCEQVLDETNHVYSTDDFFSNLTVLSKKIESINSKNPGFCSGEFVALINTLITEKDEKDFKSDVIVVAKLLFAESVSPWIEASRKYMDFLLDSSEERSK